MGRNKLSEENKKQGVFIKLSPWVKKWLKEQGRSQGATVEGALIKTHKLKNQRIYNEI